MLRYWRALRYPSRMPARVAWSRYSDERLMRVRLRDLGLTIEGTHLEGLIDKLYGELENRGLRLRPHVWLSDEWLSGPGPAPPLPGKASLSGLRIIVYRAGLSMLSAGNAACSASHRRLCRPNPASKRRAAPVWR
jgi:hypothetical protein